MKHSEPLKFDIERYFAGELDGKESSALEQHFQECAVCNTYLQTLRRERNEFLSDHPFTAFKKENLKTVTTAPWYNRLLDTLAKPALIPVYGLLLVFTVLVPVFVNRQSEHMHYGTGFKGASPLSFIYKRDGVVYDGDISGTYHENDQIQIRYSSSKDQFVSLLSIDSKGVVSFYHPEESSVFCSVKSGTGLELTFPGSIYFDDSKGNELIVVLFSEEPLRTEEVSRWISQLYIKYQGISELERAVVKEKFRTISRVSTLLLKKE